MSRSCILVLAVVAACGNKDERPKPEPPPAGSDPHASPPPPLAADAGAGSQTRVPAASDYRPKIDALLPTLRNITTDPVVVKSVQEQNAKKITMDEIQKLDKQWTSSPGIAPFMKPYLENRCVTAVKKYTSALSAVVEAFVMDDQGGLVCTIAKTSDYWQGDEAKWQKSFADGKGAEFIDKASFDDSSQAYTIQVSLPVMEKNHAIGAITVGLALEKL